MMLPTVRRPATRIIMSYTVLDYTEAPAFCQSDLAGGPIPCVRRTRINQKGRLLPPFFLEEYALY